MPSPPSNPPETGASPAPGGAPAQQARGGRGGRCVVVGYDGSPAARYAVGWAAREVGPEGRVVLVHACRPRRGWISQAALLTASERRQRGGALIDELLMDGADTLLKANVESAVLDEEPVHALIGAARQYAAEEIVVGSHHRSRLDAVHGDVAAELVRAAPVPVCVVPLGGEPSARDGAGAPA